jgi:hypothetical protein
MIKRVSQSLAVWFVVLAAFLISSIWITIWWLEKTCPPDSSGTSPERILGPWMQSFLCQAKATDLALTWLTFGLVIFTFGQVYAAVTQERSNRKVNRAYLVGGPGARGTATSPLHIVMTIGNYGKTPGILTSISWGLTEDEKIVPRRGPNVVKFEDVYPPDMRVRLYPRVSFEFDSTKPIFYGRIEYRDVWNKPHYSTWKHRIYPDGRDDAIEGAYTEWD